MDGPTAVIAKRLMCPGIDGVEGTSGGHDTIAVAKSIPYLEVPGRSAGADKAIEYLKLSTKTKVAGPPDTLPPEINTLPPIATQLLWPTLNQLPPPPPPQDPHGAYQSCGAVDAMRGVVGKTVTEVLLVRPQPPRPVCPPPPPPCAPGTAAFPSGAQLGLRWHGAVPSPCHSPTPPPVSFSPLGHDPGGPARESDGH